MIRQLTIQLRRRQLVDIYGNPVKYTGTNPTSLSAVAGTIDTTWNDFTDYVDGLQDVELEWSSSVDDSGFVQFDAFTQTKGVSGSLSFERDAYDFLKNYLIDDVSAPLNQVEVQITDTNCGNYIGYVITSKQLQWCEYNTTCVFNISLKQLDDYTQCFQRTTIADNWQGWFQDEPVDLTTGTVKKHPRFSYCIEKRPNWILVILWFLTTLLAVIYTVVYTVFYPILLVIALIEVVINTLTDILDLIIGVINTIIDAVNTLPGISIAHIPIIPHLFSPTTPTSPISVYLNFANIMIEAGGCGREHPAPLVRDYILNVCNKCGIAVDATTADLFFAPMLNITHSDGALHNNPNPYYNACYFFPQVKRGVRRFRTIDILSGFSDPDTTTYYIPDNAPVLSGEDFLNEITPQFNHLWRIQVISGIPTLFIKRKDYWNDNVYIYDFSSGGADRGKIVEGICYEQTDYTLPAYCDFLYADDAADKCGVEADGFYNGTQLVNFGNNIINPLFTGKIDKMGKYAAVHFNCDGVTTNYLYDALQVTLTLNRVDPFALPLANQVGSLIEQYANYKVLLQSETTSAPKILIWDGDTDNPSAPNYLNATAIRDKINIAGTVYTIGYSGYPGIVPGISTPPINTLYPTQVPDTGGTTFVPASIPSAIAWEVNHPPQTHVEGAAGLPSPAGVYEVYDILLSGLFPAAAILVNYPMYFEPHYLNTLWDWFHFIDDPNRVPRLGKTWNLKIPLCCEDVTKLGLVNGTNTAALAKTVLLDTQFYNIGRITDIKVGYKTGDQNGTGQYIQISGVI